MPLDTVDARTKRRRLPSVDVPQVADDGLRRSLEALQEHLRMYEGDSGAPKERFVTIEELELAGLIGTKVQNKYALIDSILGSPVSQGQQGGSTTIVSSTGAQTLAELTDTAVNGASTDEFLKFTGGKWVNFDLFGNENTWTDRQVFDGCIAIQAINNDAYVEFCHDDVNLNITGYDTTNTNLVGMDLTLDTEQAINWDTTELLFFGGDPGDPDFGNVILLLGFDDAADGATTFTDISSYGHTIVRTLGGGSSVLEIDTANPSVGDGSLLIYHDDPSDPSGWSTLYAEDAGVIGRNTTDEFTVECWFKYDGSENTTTWTLVDWAGRIYLQIAGNNFASTTRRVTATAGSAATGTYQIFTTNWKAFNDNEWTHVAFVRDNVDDKLYLYVNGVKAQGVSAGEIAIPASATCGGQTNKIRLGSNESSGSSPYVSAGTWIDDVRVTEGVCRYPGGNSFTPPDKLQGFGGGVTGDPYWSNVGLYTRLNGTDGSTASFNSDDVNANILVPTNGAQIDTAQSKFGGSSILLDNTGAPAYADYVRLNNYVGMELLGNDFTVEAWIRLASLPTTSVDGGFTIIAHYQNSGNLRGWWFKLDDSNALEFAYSTDGITVDNVCQTAFSFAVDTWYAVAAVRNGNSVYLYVDGTRIGTHTVSGSVYNQYSAFPYIGLTNTSSGFRSQFDGWIDELRLTVGVARYTGTTYTLQTEEFPTALGAAEGFTVGDPAYNTTIDGPTTTITGNAVVGGTLNVLGATDLDSTLNVDGAATFQSTTEHFDGSTWNVKTGVSPITIDGDVGDTTTPLIDIFNTGTNLDRRLIYFRETADQGFYIDGDFSLSNPNNALVVGTDIVGAVGELLWLEQTGNWRFGTDRVVYDYATRRLTMPSTDIDLGTAAFGDRINFYGGFGASNSAAIGNESTNDLFYRAGAIHRWYINTAADSGANNYLYLNVNELGLEKDIDFFQADAATATHSWRSAWNSPDYDWTFTGTTDLNIIGLTGSVVLASGIDLTVGGDLTVSGTTTTINSNVVSIADNIILLNSDEAGAPTQDAGLEVERGTSPNVFFQFDETTDRWEFTNDGTTYYNIMAMADGTATDNTLRWDGSNWVETNVLQVDAAAGQVDVTQPASTTGGYYALSTDAPSASYVGVHNTETNQYIELAAFGSTQGTGGKNTALYWDADYSPLDISGAFGVGAETWMRFINEGPDTTKVVKVADGTRLRIEDGGETDRVDIYHNGTDLAVLSGGLGQTRLFNWTYAHDTWGGFFSLNESQAGVNVIAAQTGSPTDYRYVEIGNTGSAGFGAAHVDMSYLYYSSTSSTPDYPYFYLLNDYGDFMRFVDNTTYNSVDIISDAANNPTRFRIYEPAGTDYVEMYHDGSNMIYHLTDVGGATWHQFEGTTGLYFYGDTFAEVGAVSKTGTNQYAQYSNYNVADGTNVQFGLSGSTTPYEPGSGWIYSAQTFVLDAPSTHIKHSTSTADPVLRMYDGTATNYAEFYHDTTDFNIDVAGTANWNVTGFTVGDPTLNLDASFKLIGNGWYIARDGDTSGMTIYGGDYTTAGTSNIELYGASHASVPGEIYYDATKHTFRGPDATPRFLTIDDTRILADRGIRIDGDTNTALTGTVSVTAATAAVTGVGTAFLTECNRGSTIKIGSETFKVEACASNTALTLDSNHVAGAAGVTAYVDTDPILVYSGDNTYLFGLSTSGSTGGSMNLYSPNGYCNSYIESDDSDAGAYFAVANNNVGGTIGWTQLELKILGEDNTDQAHYAPGGIIGWTTSNMPLYVGDYSADRRFLKFSWDSPDKWIDVEDGSRLRFNNGAETQTVYLEQGTNDGDLNVVGRSIYMNAQAYNTYGGFYGSSNQTAAASYIGLENTFSGTAYVELSANGPTYAFGAHGAHLYSTTAVGPLEIQGDIQTFLRFQDISTVAYVDVADQAHLRIFDGTETDYAEFYHDGTDFITDFTTTADWNITGFTGPGGIITDGAFQISRTAPIISLVETDATVDNGTWQLFANLEVLTLQAALDSGAGNAAMTITRGTVNKANPDTISFENMESGMRIRDGAFFQVFDPTNAHYLQIKESGSNAQITTNTNNIQVSAAGGLLDLISGTALRIRDGGNTDTAVFTHNGTDFTLYFTNTLDWDIGTSTNYMTGGINIRNTGTRNVHVNANAGANAVPVNVGATANANHMIGLTSETANDTLAFGLYHHDGTRLSRCGFFSTDNSTGNGEWGLSQSWSSGGNQDFRIFMGGVEKLELLQSTGNLKVPGTMTALGKEFRCDNTAPRLFLAESGSATDEGNWMLVADGGVLGLRAYNDAESAYDLVFSMNRTGQTVDSIAYQIPVHTNKYFQYRTTTTTALEDITHAINTHAGKIQGAAVFNATTSKPVWAVGSADGSVWVDATGATAHTPV